MNNPHEKILDSFLDETLNDRHPSRSAVEIAQLVQEQLRQLETDASHRDVADNNAAEIVPIPSLNVPPSPAVDPIQPSGDPRFKHAPPAKPVAPAALAPEHGDSTRSAGNWIAILSLAAVLMVAAALGIWLMQKDAVDPDDLLADNTPPSTSPKEPFVDRPAEDLEKGQPERIADNPAELPPADDPKKEIPEVENPVNNAPRIVNNDVPEDQTKLVLPPEFKRSGIVNVAAVSAREMATSVDQRLTESWNANGQQPAEHLDLRNWANRLASRVIGRALDATEMQSIDGFLSQSIAPEVIRQDLIRHFIETPKYRSELNQHWGRVLAWQMLGISPSMQTTDRDIIQARDEIAENIANNQPLDKIVYQLISAVGSTDPDADNYNRAASYLVALNKIGSREQASSHIANTFLGQRNQCAQCHDSFAQTALAGNAAGAMETQKEFFEFHSFFAQLKFEQPAGASGENFYVVNRNYLPLGREGRVEASYKYTDLKKKVHEVFPRYGDYEAGSNGFVAKVDRRSQLANLIAGSPEFGEAMVDHVWASMLNIPVSGINGTTDPVLGKLRTELATQLAANDFDLLWLVTTIASSEAFAVGVGTEEQLAANNPFLGAAPQFNVFYHRLENRRSAVGSLAIVAQAYRSGDVEAALSAGLLARVNPTVESKPRTILPFVPGKGSLWATSPAISSQLDMIADSKMSSEDKIRHVVLAALGRTARSDEIEQAAIIMENGLDARTALQDVWWSLLNSVEYSLPLDIR